MFLTRKHSPHIALGTLLAFTFGQSQSFYTAPNPDTLRQTIENPSLQSGLEEGLHRSGLEENLRAGLEEEFDRHIQAMGSIVDTGDWPQLLGKPAELAEISLKIAHGAATPKVPQELFARAKKLGDILKRTLRLSPEKLPARQTLSMLLRRWQAESMALLSSLDDCPETTAESFFNDPNSLEGNFWYRNYELILEQMRHIPSFQSAGRDPAQTFYQIAGFWMFILSTPENKFDPDFDYEHKVTEVIVRQLSDFLRVGYTTLGIPPRPPNPASLKTAEVRKIVKNLQDQLRQQPPDRGLKVRGTLQRSDAIGSVRAVSIRFASSAADKLGQGMLSEDLAAFANQRYPSPSWTPRFRQPPTVGLEELGRTETPSSRRAVIIGMGNIGRGHIAALLVPDDFDLIFADINPNLIAEANSRDSYIVTPVGSGEPVTVKNFWGIAATNTEKIAAQGPRADWIFTSVGTNNIIRLKEVTYRYIRKRIEANHLQTLNVVFAENLPVDQPQIKALKEAVLATAEDDQTRAYVENRVNFIGAESFADYVNNDVGWVGAVVSITVPPTIATASDNPLDIQVEGGGPYYLEVDKRELKNTEFIPSGFRLVENIRAAREKKLLIHNMGHAALAYFCSALGIADPAEGMRNPKIARLVERAMWESAQGLNHRYPDLFPLPMLEEYIQGLLQRFGNAELHDTVKRIGQDPMRKLQENDRLFGAAISALEAKVYPEAIQLAIAAAIRYAREVEKIPDETLAPVIELIRKHGLQIPENEAAFQESIDRLSSTGLEELDEPQFQKDNPYARSLRSLLNWPGFTEESRKRLRALKEAGPAIEQLVQRSLNNSRVRIAIMPAGSALKGYAAADSDLDYAILILDGPDPRISHFDSSKAEQIYQGAADILKGRSFKSDNYLPHALSEMFDLTLLRNYSAIAHPDPSWENWYSPGPSVTNEFADLGALFLPMAYGDPNLLEQARQNAISRFASNPREWDLIKMEHLSFITIPSDWGRSKDHLLEWLSQWGVTITSATDVQRFKRDRDAPVQLPSIDKMARAYLQGALQPAGADLKEATRDAIIAELADAPQGSGVLVVGPETSPAVWAGLEEMVKYPAFARRIVFFAADSKRLEKLRRQNPSVQVVEEYDLAKLTLFLMTLPEADRVSVLGTLLAGQLQQQLRELLITSMSIIPLDGGTSLRMILQAVGLEENVLDQIEPEFLGEQIRRRAA